MHAGQGGVSANLRRVRVRVRGRVQGVWYRASTRDEARRLGLTGWVRNQPDGTVELEAQGPVDAVTALIAWCHDGPPHASVSAVEVTDAAVRDDERDFAITF